MAVDQLEYFKVAEQEYIETTQIIETNISRLETAKDGKKEDLVSKISKKIYQAQRNVRINLKIKGQ